MIIIFIYLLFNHITLYISYLGMNYNNVIGYLLIIIFIFQLISGILLSIYYTNYYLISFDSVYYIIFDVKFGFIIRFYHILGASLFMIFIFIHLLRGYWLRLFIIDYNYSYFIWFIGIILLIIIIIEGFLGYILNWGQMSYWGINVIINIISSFGLFNFISINLCIILLIWSSSYVIINRIFMVHFLLGLIIGLFIFIHLFIIHLFSSINSLFSSYSSLIIPFYCILFNDLYINYIIFLFIFSNLLFYDIDIFGNSDNLIYANSILTPNHILPEWYFLLFYSILRAFYNKNIGILIVLALFILLLLHVLIRGYDIFVYVFYI